MLKQKEQPLSERVHVKLLYTFGRHGEDLFSPFAMTISKADDIYISCENHKLCVYSVGGELKKIVYQNPFYGLPGNCLPNMGCAVTMEGYVAVAMRKDITQGKVHVAVIESLAGREVALCSVKPPHLTKCTPSGVTILSNGFIAVSDIGNHCIYVFNKKLKCIQQFGQFGHKVRQFQYPYFLTSTAHGNVLVSDYDNHCIKEFTCVGKHVRNIGSVGSNRGQFHHPMGLCADENGNIFVCDRDNHRVQMFGPDGKFMKMIIKSTCRDGLDIRPQDVKLTNCHLLVVLLRGIEGLDFAEIHILKYNRTGAEFEASHRQLFLVKDSLDSLHLNPLRSRTSQGILPPIRGLAGTNSPSAAAPSAPILQPDLIPRTDTEKQDKETTNHTSNPASTLCVIS